MPPWVCVCNFADPIMISTRPASRDAAVFPERSAFPALQRDGHCRVLSRGRSPAEHGSHKGWSALLRPQAAPRMTPEEWVGRNVSRFVNITSKVFG